MHTGLPVGCCLLPSPYLNAIKTQRTQADPSCICQELFPGHLEGCPAGLEEVNKDHIQEEPEQAGYQTGNWVRGTEPTPMLFCLRMYGLSWC